MFKLPDLPYSSDALAPVLSGEQMRIHHDKHHARYVDTLNTMLKESGEQPATLEEVVRSSFATRQQKPKLFNNAGQAWNHGFFWECMTPNDSAPSGEITQAISNSFGGMDQLKAKLVDESFNHFASGWGWLVAKGRDLDVISTHDADTALVREGMTPLLTVDVWEHAYYVDYKNDRKAFLERWFDEVVNWRFVEEQYAAANGEGEGYRFPAPTYG
jgi:superoxide dismutase, Fe-Mn family